MRVETNERERDEAGGRLEWIQFRKGEGLLGRGLVHHRSESWGCVSRGRTSQKSHRRFFFFGDSSSSSSSFPGGATGKGAAKEEDDRDDGDDDDDDEA